MLVWWHSLTLFQQIMVSIASPATILIVLQLIFVMLGFSSDDSLDTSPDGDVSDMDSDFINDEGFLSFGSMKVLTVRGILAFLSVGGWVAMALSYITVNWAASLIGIAAGTGMALVIAIAMHYASKLQQSGNILYRNAIGKTATVYIRIPAKRGGKGKINLTLQERFIEADAISNEKDMLTTGSAVKVIGLEDENTFIVEKFKQ